MQEYNITIKISKEKNITRRVAEGTRFVSLAEEYQAEYNEKIVLVLLNNKLRELSQVIDNDGEVSFVTMTDRDGTRAYRRSITLLSVILQQHLLYLQAPLRVRLTLRDRLFLTLQQLLRVISRQSPFR